ncbi:phage integrase central domain-containing protein, partial [Serratia sp. (in: enterobacteria)]|uniref:phage integrase central domain-containing protein n=1 Tax=Serratia sp. (in: enterobacteria) TaxID=616 RepID=UPI003988F78E
GFLEVAMRLQQRIVSIMRYAIQNQMIKYNPALDLSGAIAVRPCRACLHLRNGCGVVRLLFSYISH